MDSTTFANLYGSLTSSHSLTVFPYGSNLRTILDQGIKTLSRLDLRSFLEAWIDVRTWMKWPTIGLPALLFATYITSVISFQITLNRNNSSNSNDHSALREAPVVPYWIPGLCHALGFLQPAKYLLDLQRRFKSDVPLQLRAGPIRLFFCRNVEDVKAAFRASKKTSNKSTTLFALQNLFDLPKSAVRFYLADDSGMGRVPREGSSVAEENRINYLINSHLKKNLSSACLEDLDRKYIEILLRHLDSFNVADEWVEFPDLYAFIQRAVMKPSAEAMAGSEFFKVNPDFIDDLLIFQQHVPGFLHLLPRWLIHRAYGIRKKLLHDVKRWHQHAHNHYDCSRLGPEDPHWEPYFGSRLMRARANYTLNMKEMTPDALATEDLGLIFAATTNVGTSIFWFVYEALRDRDLLFKLEREISECTTRNGTDIDIKKLTAQPLLQSTYAEVLRMYVVIVASRLAEYENINIGGYAIPKNSYLVMCNRTAALDYAAWHRAGRSLKKSLDEFDGERFLVEDDWVRPELASLRKPKSTLAKSSNSPSPGKRFTMEGLLGLWYPYGGGDHICPGRHYAKHQMMLSFAMLFANFDLELTEVDTQKLAPNMRFAPFGALPPIGTVPFRMRRKAMA